MLDTAQPCSVRSAPLWWSQLIRDRLEELHSHSEEWQRQTAAEKQRILSKKRGAAGGQPAAQTAVHAADTSPSVRV